MGDVTLATPLTLAEFFRIMPAKTATRRNHLQKEQSMTYRFTADGRKVSLLGYGAMRLATVDGKHANGWAAGSSKADRQVKNYLLCGLSWMPCSAPQWR